MNPEADSNASRLHSRLCFLNQDSGSAFQEDGIDSPDPKRSWHASDNGHSQSHSITLSARPSNSFVGLMPSVLAVLRLITR